MPNSLSIGGDVFAITGADRCVEGTFGDWDLVLVELDWHYIGRFAWDWHWIGGLMMD